MTDILINLIRNTTFHNLGIAPISATIARHDFDKMLASLPAEEARKMKRKFRKLWRKYCKSLPERYRQQMGLGQNKPTRSQKNLRKCEVLRKVNQDHVYPAVNKLTDSEILKEF